MSETTFKVGDVVWRPFANSTQVKKTCPVCFGKRHVTVILGDESMVDTPCDYCGRGYDGPKGYDLVYEFTVTAEPDTIRSIQVTSTEDGEVREYRLSSGHHAKDLYETREEALAAAEAMRAAREAEQERFRKHGKENSERSFSWHVGYHNQQIKDAQRRIEWSTARVQACKDAGRIERAKKRRGET